MTAAPGFWARRCPAAMCTCRRRERRPGDMSRGSLITRAVPSHFSRRNKRVHPSLAVENHRNKLHIVAALLRLPKHGAILCEVVVIYGRPSDVRCPGGKLLKKLGSTGCASERDSILRKMIPVVHLSLVFHVGVGFALEWKNTRLRPGCTLLDGFH